MTGKTGWIAKVQDMRSGRIKQIVSIRYERGQAVFVCANGQEIQKRDYRHFVILETAIGGEV